MRAGEVIKLSLDDIDWDSGQLTIHGKGGRSVHLPLPADVGRPWPLIYGATAHIQRVAVCFFGIELR